MARLLPRRLPPDASKAEQLRYVRRWAVVGAISGAPFWVLVFLWIHTGWVKLVFVAIAVLTVLNIVSLTWRIGRAERR